jgi:PAS domain S-box-containing protein
VVLFVAAAFFVYERQQSLILKVAVDNARLIAKQIIESRDYMSSVVHDEPAHNYALVPQVVATQIAKRITKDSPYYVRQVSMRYRNPNNRPDPYETARLQEFAARAAKETSEVVTAGGIPTFRYMLSMAAEKSCLKCHGKFEEAPKFIQDRFPRGHYSYNYKEGEIIGAVSVSVPMAELYRDIGVNLRLDLLSRGAIFFLIIAIMGALTRRLIITPVKLLSETIIRVTRTGNFAERLPKSGDDEIGRLIDAFNDMMDELSRKTAQSRESEERYRKFIEMARSAVVTFMEDGKIVISNQRAEELLGLTRQALLGESIYRFLIDGEMLREGIAAYLRDGKGGGVGETTLHKVRDIEGRVTGVEMALSASKTDHSPMFTVILRELQEKRIG